MGSTARKLGGKRRARDVYRRMADEIAACRAGVERLLAVVADETAETASCPITADVDASVRALFTDPAKPDGVREPDGVGGDYRGRPRPVRRALQARELADALDGIEAAKQLGRLAKRVSDLRAWR